MKPIRITDRGPSVSAETLPDLRPLRWWTARWPGLSSGRRLALATLYRFALTGSCGVRLATRKVPGVGLCCTAADVAEFLERIEAVRQGPHRPPERGATAARRRRTNAIPSRHAAEPRRTQP